MSRTDPAPYCLVAIDVGGTFTDLTSYEPDTGRLVCAKAPSVPDHPEDGVLAAIDRAGVDLARCRLLVHGTTVATNTLLERSGPRIGLLTTEGFRDVIELGRTTRLVPGTLYDPYFERAAPLVQRRDRLAVPERTTPGGDAALEPDRSGLEAAAATLRKARIEAVAIGFLNSYANPSNEKRAREVFLRHFPFVSISSEVLNEVREFERLSTTVINVYLMPRMSRYGAGLRRRLRSAGLAGAFRTIASNGGLLDEGDAETLPVLTVLSGPAAGLAAASHLMAGDDGEGFITYDMGGTSTDVALHGPEGWAVKRETLLDGLLLRVPQLDIQTIGAGGGSIAECDAGGSLSVGPTSAGADPGPAAYGRGGTLPTVTDANLLLGRLADGQRLGDSLTLDKRAARRGLGALGSSMGLDETALAEGIIAVAVAKMAEAIYEISVARGYDPRRLALVAYGGAGPLHACEVATALGIERVVIPPSPGAFSAFGGLCAPQARDRVESLLLTLDERGAVELSDAAARLADALLVTFPEETGSRARVVLRHEVDARYHGQAHELTVPIPAEHRDGFRTEFRAQRIRKAFEDAFLRAHGRLDEDKTIEIVNLRTIAEVPASPPPLCPPPHRESALSGHRRVFAAGHWVNAPVRPRSAIGSAGDEPAETGIVGPLVVEEATATIWVPPGWRIATGARGGLEVRAGPDPGPREGEAAAATA